MRRATTHLLLSGLTPSGQLQHYIPIPLWVPHSSAFFLERMSLVTMVTNNLLASSAVPFEHHPSDEIVARLQNMYSTSPDTVSLPRTIANHYNPYPSKKRTFFNHLKILHSHFYIHSNFIFDPFLFRWSLILFLFINTSNFIHSLWSNIFFRFLPLSELCFNWCWIHQKNQI